MKLSQTAIDTTITRYTERFDKYGYSPKTLGWDKGKQNIRFDILISQFDLLNKSILDIGCGFGKSTLPFVSRFPNADVEAIDISAPCLILAAQTARDSESRNVHYRQMDAQDTRYDDESFDLVTSTMFLHELPTEAINGVLDEAFRLLRPGGYMAHLDFYIIPDAFQRFLHYGHGIRNNEPFMQDLAEMDLHAVLSSKGFEEIAFKPFRESEDIDMNANDVWRFPWTIISGKKPDGRSS